MLRIFRWRNLKSTLQLKDQSKFWCSSRQNIGSNQAWSRYLHDDNFKHVALFNCFKKGFNCIAYMKVLILVSKKNTLKATETVKYFSCTFYHEPRFSSHQFDAATLLKINLLKKFEMAISSNLKRSNLQNLCAWC